MKASLQIVQGADAGRKIDLRVGQVAQFGKTDWADFAFRSDAAMADVHFVVECRSDGCRLKALAADRDTLVNDEKVQDAVLHTGDRITAGRTTFVVAIEGEAAPAKPAPPAEAETTPPADAPAPGTDFPNLCAYLSLDAALVHAQADPAQSRDAFLARLAAANQHPLAVRFCAHWLPKRAAVWWGCLCVREACGTLPDPQQHARLAAEQWVTKFDEPSRRQAETAMADAGYAGAGGMLAAAAFGSGESIAPVGAAQAVPPDPRLTGHCVTTALAYAAVAGDSRLAPQRWALFLTLAQDCMAGKIKLPGTE